MIGILLEKLFLNWSFFSYIGMGVLLIFHSGVTSTSGIWDKWRDFCIWFLSIFLFEWFSIFHLLDWENDGIFLGSIIERQNHWLRINFFFKLLREIVPYFDSNLKSFHPQTFSGHWIIANYNKYYQSHT